MNDTRTSGRGNDSRSLNLLSPVKICGEKQNFSVSTLGRQRAYHKEHGVYAATLHTLHHRDIFGDASPEPTMQVTQSMYEITLPGYNGTTLHIRQDGKVWMSDNSQ